MITSTIDYAKTTEKLVSNLRKKVRNYSDCQDIAQNILLYAIQTYDPSLGASFESYCFTVSRGKTIDFMRSKNRKGNLVSLDILCDNSNNSEEPSFEIAEDSNKYDILELAEGVLDEYEMFIVLKKLEGHDGYEIAHMMNKSAAYISKTLSKAIEKLSKEI